MNWPPKESSTNVFVTSIRIPQQNPERFQGEFGRTTHINVGKVQLKRRDNKRPVKGGKNNPRHPKAS